MNLSPQLLVIILSIFFTSFCLHATTQKNNNFHWPDNKKAAVSLAYDDALASQLDNAIPALNKYHFKASFYLPLASASVKDRLKEWRMVAKQGHELGNHTINHACSGSKPSREWVEKHNDLDTRSIQQIIQEVKTANSFLQAIDGETIRTFTVPCTDHIVENKNYVKAVSALFVGIKYSVGGVVSNKNKLNMMKMPVIVPVGINGKTLIDYVKEAKKHGTMVNFTFHGIGGDHLSTSNKAHEQLLKYLANNKNDYWVDTYRNISLYVSDKKQ